MKRRDAMDAGEKINTTDRRAVLHVALRSGIFTGHTGKRIVSAV